MPKYDIDKIEELLQKGTQGDWDVVGYTTVVNHAAHQRIADVAGHSAEERAANAQLIPALRNAAPAMIADLRRLGAERDELRASYIDAAMAREKGGEEKTR